MTQFKLFHHEEFSFEYKIEGQGQPLLIIGSSGFFGNSIVEFISKKNKFFQRINKIILISRKQKNKFARKLKKNFQVKELKVDMQKTKTLPNTN